MDFLQNSGIQITCRIAEYKPIYSRGQVAQIQLERFIVLLPHVLRKDHTTLAVVDMEGPRLEVCRKRDVEIV